MEVANVVIYLDRLGRYTIGQAGPTAPRFSPLVRNIVRRVVNIPAIKAGRYDLPLMVGGFNDPAHTAALAAALKKRLPQLEIITQ